MKKSKKVSVKTVKTVKPETRRATQKTDRIYGMIGMVVLFLVGVIFGYVINGSDHVNHSAMSNTECEELVQNIKYLIHTNQYDQLRIANAMYSENCVDRGFKRAEIKVEEKKLPDTTCGKIENLLTERLTPDNEQGSNEHIYNAKIYANLSERGCPENSEKYKNLAKQELEIARALNDDNLNDQYASVEIVETYKRLKMQQEAERMIEKAKKLTSPAIDFIIQLEKIIEE